MILDEASATLDAETEKRIQQSLFDGSSGSKKRITIAVAHRLATIRNADEIIAMVDGAIVERGKHEGLIANENVYASQWSIQNRRTRLVGEELDDIEWTRVDPGSTYLGSNNRAIIFGALQAKTRGFYSALL